MAGMVGGVGVVSVVVIGAVLFVLQPWESPLQPVQTDASAPVLEHNARAAIQNAVATEGLEGLISILDDHRPDYGGASWFLEVDEAAQAASRISVRIEEGALGQANEILRRNRNSLRELGLYTALRQDYNDRLKERSEARQHLWTALFRNEEEDEAKIADMVANHFPGDEEWLRQEFRPAWDERRGRRVAAEPPTTLESADDALAVAPAVDPEANVDPPYTEVRRQYGDADARRREEEARQAVLAAIEALDLASINRDNGAILRDHDSALFAAPRVFNPAEDSSGSVAEALRRKLSDAARDVIQREDPFAVEAFLRSLENSSISSSVRQPAQRKADRYIRDLLNAWNLIDGIHLETLDDYKRLVGDEVISVPAPSYSSVMAAAVAFREIGAIEHAETIESPLREIVDRVIDFLTAANVDAPNAGARLDELNRLLAVREALGLFARSFSRIEDLTVSFPRRVREAHGLNAAEQFVYRARAWESRYPSVHERMAGGIEELDAELAFERSLSALAALSNGSSSNRSNPRGGGSSNSFDVARHIEHLEAFSRSARGLRGSGAVAYLRGSGAVASSAKALADALSDVRGNSGGLSEQRLIRLEESVNGFREELPLSQRSRLEDYLRGLESFIEILRDTLRESAVPADDAVTREEREPEPADTEVQERRRPRHPL